MFRVLLMSVLIVILSGVAPTGLSFAQLLPAADEVAPGNAILPIGPLPMKAHPLPNQVRALTLDSGEIVELRYGAEGINGRPVSVVRRGYTGNVETTTDEIFEVRNATLATDGERVAVAWEASRADGLSAVFMRLHDRSLLPLSDIVQVSGVSDANRFAPALAVDDDQILVAFEAAPPITEAWQRTSLFARRFDWQAQPIGSAFRVDEPPVGDLERGVTGTHATMLGNGDAVIVWLDYTGGEGSLGDARVAAFDLSGPAAVQTLEEQILGVEEEVSLSQTPHALIGLTDGGYVLVWDTASVRPRAQIFNSDHSARTAPFPLLQTSESILVDERALVQMNGASLADGGFVVSWTGTCFETSAGPCPDPVIDPQEDYFDGSSLGTFVRSFDANGQPLGPSRLLHPRAEGAQTGFVLPSARHLAGNKLNLASVPALFVEIPSNQAMSEDEGFLRFLTPPCAPDADTACTGADSRFRIEARWRDFGGSEGRGLVQQQKDAWASFSFFDPGQIDLVVKIIDARSFSNNHWIFFSSLSDVFFEVSVLDSQTGLSRVYRNQSGVFASQGDTVGLPEIDPPDQDVVGQAGLAPSFDRLQDEVRSGSASGSFAFGAGCTPSATRLCFFDRFAAEVTWTDFSNLQGVGQKLELSGDSQAFWFFDPSNPELTLKMLDGTAINGSYWLFFGSLSNVAFELKITDMQMGVTRTWTNSSGTFASLGDVDAFKNEP